MLLPIRSTISVAVVTPERSISSRVIVCRGDTPSASVRGMFEPVMVTRWGWSCCAHADETVNAETTPAVNARDIDTAPERRAFVVFIFPPLPRVKRSSRGALVGRERAAALFED